MDNKLATLSELPAARLTWERLLASMNAHVLLQVRIAYESLATQCTYEWTLPSVFLQMLRQMSGLLIAFVTLQTVRHKINWSYDQSITALYSELLVKILPQSNFKYEVIPTWTWLLTPSRDRFRICWSRNVYGCQLQSCNCQWLDGAPLPVSTTALRKFLKCFETEQDSKRGINI